MYAMQGGAARRTRSGRGGRGGAAATCIGAARRAPPAPHLVLGRVRAVDGLVRHLRAALRIQRLGQRVAADRQQLVHARRAAAWPGRRRVTRAVRQ